MRARQRLRTLLTAGVAAATAATLLAGLVGSSANADTRSEKEKADQAVNELKQEVAESSAQLAAAEAAYAAAEAQLKDARTALSRAHGQVAAAQAREADLTGKLDAAKLAERQAEIALGVLNDKVDVSEQRLGAMIRQAYQYGPVPELVLAFDANTFQQYADQRAYLDQISSSQNALVEELRLQRAAVASQEAVLAKRRAEAAELQAAATAQVKERQAAEEAARAAATRVEQLVDEQEAAVEAAERERAEDLRQYEAMQAEAKRLEEQLAAEIAAAQAARERAESDDSAPAPSDGALLRPVDGPVTSSFGWRYHPILHYRKLHTGTDFGAPSGTPVRAAASGKVIQSGWSNGYGNRIVVSHGYIDGVHLATTYNHLSSRLVSVGERVDRGEVIGKVGSTGYSTGPHLHFEVLVNGEFRDPMDWL